MSKGTEKSSFFEKLATVIVDKRNLIFFLYACALIFCLFSRNWVSVCNDITEYLPETTETRQGLTLMEEEFTTFGTARVMVSHVTYEIAEELAEQMEQIEGVTSATFGSSTVGADTGGDGEPETPEDITEYFKGADALISVTFDGEEEDEISLAALAAIRELLEPYDYYIDSAVGNSQADSLASEMGTILAVAAVIIVLVLLLTSRSYAEIPVLLITFIVAALLNLGTNFIFGEISFVSNSVTVVLQLALAIDYAIIFCHRYMEERDNGLDAREADIAALSKAIIEISSSSLTTISGLVALMMMQLRIGFDMGIVLAKGIVCSMLCVFLLMPGLLMLFNRGIEKTRHKNLVPSIAGWGRLIMKLRFVLPAVFAVCVIGGIYCSNQCDYVFSTNSTNSGNRPETRIAMDKINETFGYTNTIAVLVPRGDYDSEGAVLRRVEALDNVTTATGLANIEVEDGRYLTDKLTPRQFAELAGVDIELARLLYQAYGLSVEEYGAIFQDTDDYSVPLLDVFQFLLEQKDKGVIRLSGEQASQVEELQDTLDDGLQQLQGEQWTRMVFTADLPEEGAETYALLDQIRAIAAEYYGDDVVLVGNSTNARDLAASFTGDNLKISVLTVLFVVVILLFTFKSAGLPILLVLTIQGSIWINFSFPFLTGTNLFFMSYLIVSAIQMGATIDYAIVITNRYLQLKTVLDRRAAAVEALNQSFPTVLTSGSIMTVAGFLIGKLSTDTIISSIGDTLGRGTLTSIVLVMTVLPQLLVLGDALIERTAITLNRDRKQRFQNGTMRLDGHVRGHVSGFIDGEFKGVLHGSVDALIESKRQELDETEE